MSDISSDVRAALDAIADLLADPALAPWPTRADDLALIDTTRTRLERRYGLAVVGEFSSGKSYLLNALTGKTRYDAQGRIAGPLATDINPSTATITELEYGTEERAIASYPSGRTERIPLEGLSRFVAVGKDAPGSLHDSTADPSGPDQDAAPDFVRVALDSPFLRAGFTIADTPGLASLNPAHRRATLAYLPRTDAVLYLIDTQQPFSEGDAAFLGIVGEHVRTIFIVQTKIDLWKMKEPDGREAWEAARARIAERAARFAPGAEVYSVSARDYAAGTLDGDEALAEASGFPKLTRDLERTLDERVRAARVARTVSVIGELMTKTSARIRRDAALAESDAAELRAERERASAHLDEREAELGRERDDTTARGAARAAWIAERGRDLATAAERALGSAIDVADIERIRDRGRFHSLVDATVVPVWTAFANDVASTVADELTALEARSGDLGVADLAARRLGGEPGAGAWARDLRSGIASTIVLGAVGGPAVDFVARVARGFASRPHGTYMKRELGADLGSEFFPALAADVERFATSVAERIGGIYADIAASIERGRTVARAEALDPIDRALALRDAGDAERRKATDDLGVVTSALAGVDALLERLQTESAAKTAAPGAPHDAAPREELVEFDADAYEGGLVATRYRVVVLGALRRGKSSLINAIAGTRLLQDDTGTEARFPVHVRYGERERAYELDSRSVWQELDPRAAMAAAARAPVLIETPWSMPKQLVLVHAPAFDSGDDDAEEIAFAAAAAASEVIALFSRQLSDRELALFARVGELNVPLSLVHTIADNESAAERRTVVELAARYARERGLTVARVFTISALDYFEAQHARRAAAAWNELGALRETLASHAQEHMNKLAERERRATSAKQASTAAAAEPKRPQFWPFRRRPNAS